MKTLALDASSTCTGWSVFEDSKYLASGFINLKKDKNSEHRLYEMAKEITDLISYFKPHKIILEDTYSSPNISTLKTLANLAGAIKFYCYLHEIPVEMIMPSAWRKYLKIQEKGAKRNELKNKALNLVNEQLGLLLEEDQAESVCINLAVAVRDGLFKLKEIPDEDIW